MRISLEKPRLDEAVEVLAERLPAIAAFVLPLYEPRMMFMQAAGDGSAADASSGWGRVRSRRGRGPWGKVCSRRGHGRGWGRALCFPHVDVVWSHVGVEILLAWRGRMIKKIEAVGE